MRTYLVRAQYSSGTWARMFHNPGDRLGLANALYHALGGELRWLCWDLPTASAYGIADLPDNISLTAMTIVGVRTGALTALEAHALLTEEQLDDAIEHAKRASPSYQPPAADG